MAKNPLTIDTEKLLSLLNQDLFETGVGGCSETIACIGRVDGREIWLTIQASESKFMDCTEHHCVSRAK